MSANKETDMKSKIILIGGAPGCGKVPISKQIAVALDAAYLNKNNISDYFAEALLKAHGCDKYDRDSDAYHTHVMPLEYNILINTALQNAELGNHVVCCAPFIHYFADKDWLARIDLYAKTLGAELVLAWVQADPQGAKQRLIEKQESYDHWKLNNWAKYLDTNPYELPEMSLPVTVINNIEQNNESLQVQVDHFIKQMQ